MRIQWEYRKDSEDMATLHCDHLLPDAKPDVGELAMLFFKPVKPSAESNEFRDAMMAIHGVTGMRSEHCSLTVSKGRVFSWDEIQPRVESVVKESLGIGSDEQVIRVQQCATADTETWSPRSD